MKYIKKIKLLIILFVFFLTSQAQSVKLDSINLDKKTAFNYQSLIVPTIFICYGIVGLENNTLLSINKNIYHQIKNQNYQKLKIDNVTQYVPAVSVYGLSGLGIQGKNNFKDKTIVLATASLIMTASTLGLKSITSVYRPDNSSDDSFPSGHVAKAFMGAEFLYQEYKEVSPWYGIVGYIVAAGTGSLRIYNDKHWLTDVVAGAGIGILSTKIAYWIKPFVAEKIRKKKENKTTAMLFPFYDGENAIIGMIVNY